MKFAFINAEKATYPVSLLCSVLAVSRSGFYAWQDRAPSKRAKDDARLAAEVAATHARSRNVYGSPRVHADLKARGVRVGKNRIARLMREQGLRARQRRRFRQTSAPNDVWVGDVTFIWTREGWLDLAVMIDLFARRVVGWATSTLNDRQLVPDALESAIAARGPPAGLIHHSDRGSTYASDDYRRALERHELVASMSRKGDCWDNAVAESFFTTLRAELLDHVDLATREAAHAVVGEYIESFYNPARRHSHLDYVSPIEAELKSTVAALAA